MVRMYRIGQECVQNGTLAQFERISL